ncbi:unnamed protein product [Caretta caretta]
MCVRVPLLEERFAACRNGTYWTRQLSMASPLYTRLEKLRKRLRGVQGTGLSNAEKICSFRRDSGKPGCACSRNASIKPLNNRVLTLCCTFLGDWLAGYGLAIRLYLFLEVELFTTFQQREC